MQILNFLSYYYDVSFDRKLYVTEQSICKLYKLRCMRVNNVQQLALRERESYSTVDMMG